MGIGKSVNNISGWVLKQFTPEARRADGSPDGNHEFYRPGSRNFLGLFRGFRERDGRGILVYANKGVYNAPMMVTKIEDKYGNVLANFYPESREVITENTAFLMANLLRGLWMKERSPFAFSVWF